MVWHGDGLGYYSELYAVSGLSRMEKCSDSDQTRTSFGNWLHHEKWKASRTSCTLSISMNSVLLQPKEGGNFNS